MSVRDLVAPLCGFLCGLSEVRLPVRTHAPCLLSSVAHPAGAGDQQRGRLQCRASRPSLCLGPPATQGGGILRSCLALATAPRGHTDPNSTPPLDLALCPPQHSQPGGPGPRTVGWNGPFTHCRRSSILQKPHEIFPLNHARAHTHTEGTNFKHHAFVYITADVIKKQSSVRIRVFNFLSS